jgi:hypothetical protein
MRIRTLETGFRQAGDARQFRRATGKIRPGMNATAWAQAKSRNIGACFRLDDAIAERMWLGSGSPAEACVGSCGKVGS